MKTIIFSTNLKRLIKKKGFKITSFAPDHLKMTVQTFNNKTKNGSFNLNDIYIIESVLNTSFLELSTKIEGVEYHGYNKPIKQLSAKKERSDTKKQPIKKTVSNKYNFKHLKSKQ